MTNISAALLSCGVIISFGCGPEEVPTQAETATKSLSEADAGRLAADAARADPAEIEPPAFVEFSPAVARVAIAAAPEDFVEYANDTAMDRDRFAQRHFEETAGWCSRSDVVGLFRAGPSHDVSVRGGRTSFDTIHITTLAPLQLLKVRGMLPNEMAVRYFPNAHEYEYLYPDGQYLLFLTMHPDGDFRPTPGSYLIQVDGDEIAPQRLPIADVVQHLTRRCSVEPDDEN